MESERSYQMLLARNQKEWREKFTQKDWINAHKNYVKPEYSIKEMSQRLNINYNTLRRELSQMEKRGEVTRVSRGRYEM